MAKSATQKSTSVRAKTTALRAGFALAERLAPSLAARYATRLWFTVPAPPRVPPTPPGGEPFTVDFRGRRVRGHSYGRGPVVYLVHGWGGIAGQLSAFVDPLRRRGFRVVVFDAPSHGASDPGEHGPNRTHGLEFARAFGAVASRFGPAHAVVAHSMGALPTLLTQVDGLAIGKLVLLAPMRDLDTHLDRFAGQLGMGPRARRALTVPRVDLRLLVQVRLVRHADHPAATGGHLRGEDGGAAQHRLDGVRDVDVDDPVDVVHALGGGPAQAGHHGVHHGAQVPDRRGAGGVPPYAPPGRPRRSRARAPPPAACPGP